jgi:hypothetical protein
MTESELDTLLRELLGDEFKYADMGMIDDTTLLADVSDFLYEAQNPDMIGRVFSRGNELWFDPPDGSMHKTPAAIGYYPKRKRVPRHIVAKLNLLFLALRE